MGHVVEVLNSLAPKPFYVKGTYIQPIILLIVVTLYLIVASRTRITPNFGRRWAGRSP